MKTGNIHPITIHYVLMDCRQENTGLLFRLLTPLMILTGLRNCCLLISVLLSGLPGGFIILIGIVLTTGIYMLFRYRLQQKINLLEMRNRISQDLHDEIGASISGINLLSQMASRKVAK